MKKELTETRVLRTDPAGEMEQRFGERYHRYRKLWDDASAYRHETRTPIHLDFELNYTCNLRCILCPHGIPEASKPDYAAELMPFELFKKVLDEGLARDLNSIRLSQLNEPLLRDDLEQFASYARDAGVIDIMLNTNGMLLTAERSRRLIESGVTQIRVSLDAATPETYAKVRKGGDYGRVVANIRDFLKIRDELGVKLPLLRVSFVRCSINSAEQEQFIEQWREQADFCALSDYANWVVEDSRASEKFASDARPNRFTCMQPWQRGTVFANGDFIPCCSEYYRQIPVGNLYRQGLEEIWSSAAMHALRIAHRDGQAEGFPICRLCETASRGE